MIFDLIAGTGIAAEVVPWTPLELFKNGELGFWFDGSDNSTMWKESHWCAAHRRPGGSCRTMEEQD